MPVCRIEEKDKGGPYPRSCPTCKFGACAKGLDRDGLKKALEKTIQERDAAEARFSTCNKVAMKAADDAAMWKTRAEAAEAKVTRLINALTPSGDTKAAYIGEIKDPETGKFVSWTAIKQVMAMIRKHAEV